MYNFKLLKLFSTKMFNCLKMDFKSVTLSFHVSGDLTPRLFNISFSYNSTCSISEIKMNSNDDFKCNGCHEMSKLNATFGLHSCMGILCVSCLKIETCQKCGISIDQDHQIVVHNHEKTCKFCDIKAKWICACHSGEFCNSCLILIHGDGFKDKVINKYPVSFEPDVMCENCLFIPAEFMISSDKQICFVCLPKQETMMNFQRIGNEKRNDETRLANLFRKLSQESFIENMEKSIKAIIQNNENTEKHLIMYMAMLKENRMKNEDLISSIKPGINFVKMLQQFPPQIDNLFTLICSKQIDAAFFKKIFEPFIMNRELCLTNTLVEYKESPVNLIDSFLDDDHQICTEPVNMIIEHDYPPSKKPRHEERRDGHAFDSDASIQSESNLDIGMEQFCTWNLVAFKDTKSCTVKIVYYRCPLYLICITPGLDATRADLLKDIKKMKEFKKINDPQQDDVVIIKDKYGEPFKRGKILRKEGYLFVIKQIDHGPVLSFTRNEIYECPMNLKNVPDTTFRVSLIGIAPRSKFAFISTKNDGAKEFMKNNLILKSKMINIKRKYVTTDSTFCNITTVIHGQEIDWTEELLKANLGDRWTDNNGCFLPKFDYCYMFHVFDKCSMSDKCYRSHVCPFCSSTGHPLCKCSSFKKNENEP